MTDQELMTANVTLNGEKAVVSGFGNEFATVRQLKSGLSAEWSWNAVDRIVSRDGKFLS